jgi:hypothetical protein
MINELIVYVAGGNTIRTGGDKHKAGAYVRICNSEGKEIAYWDKQEWKDDPESVMGAILLCAAGCKI